MDFKSIFVVYINYGGKNMIMTKNFKFGFTLAEVLITLAIIGIVAALTIPALLQRYQEKMTEARLAKFYSMMNQAIQMSTIENGAPETWDGAFREVDSEGNRVNKTDVSAALFDKYLGKYIKITRRKEVFDSQHNRKMLIYYLPDGSAFGYPPHTNIDIHYFPHKPENCLKRTSANGICRFMFSFAPQLTNKDNYKYMSKVGISPYLYHWDGTKDSLYKGGEISAGCDPSEGGGYCTTVIAQNGWKIPDDYPRKIRY